MIPPNHTSFPQLLQNLPLKAFIFPTLSPAPQPFILPIDLASVKAKKDLPSLVGRRGEDSNSSSKSC